MASACVNAAASPPDPSPDLAPACPRISFAPEPDAKDLADFEFRPDDRPAAMLPADELFAGGKLLPLHFPAADPAEEIRPAEIRRLDASPKAPKCSSRWRELLGLKNKKPSGVIVAVAAAAAHSKNTNSKSFKQLLHRGGASRSSAETSLSLPLLRDSDSESVSLSSRRSLSSSSSSSGPDHEDIPRLSLDSDKPAPAPASSPTVTTAPTPILLSRNAARARARAAAAARASRSPARRAPDAPAPAESPRMNASGRVVFERSSSSPGSFTGGPRVRQRGMERSYSAGVRVAPVLNVPVFGLGQLFKKDRDAAAAPARSSAVAASAGGGPRVRIERERA